MCYAMLCAMYYVVQGIYVSYLPYVVQKTLNALIIPYMVMCYVLCSSGYLCFLSALCGSKDLKCPYNPLNGSGYLCFLSALCGSKDLQTRR